MQANPLFPIKGEFPVLEKDLNVDIVVVGAGIAGISAAYSFANAGYKTVILEEQEVGAGATSASSGILYYGTGTTFTNAIELFGKKNAEMIWKESKKTIEEIEKLIEKNSIECDFRRPGAIMAAKNEQERDFLEKELQNLNSIGFEGEILDSKEIKNYYTEREFVAGLNQSFVPQIAPGLFTVGLAKAANIDIYSKTPLIKYEELDGQIIVETPKAKVKAQKILFATNRKPFFGLENHFSVENSVIYASKKLGEKKLKEIWPEHRIIWTLEDKYDIIYEHDGRAILELYYSKGAQEKMKYYFTSFEFNKEFVWGDAWAKTKDWLPIFGRISKNVFISIAMGDQGIVMGHTTGRKAVKLMEQEEDEFLRLVSPSRFGL